MMGQDEYLDYVSHEVSLDTFYMGKFPVTQAQWKAVMGGNNNPSYFQGDRRPMDDVRWQDAQNFIQKLSGISLRAYRFPTEAEWEFAARGGNLSKSYVYAGSNELDEVGWFEKNCHNETKAVGQKFSNELGIFDMSGNVWEWCADWYSEEYYQACLDKGMIHNPRGPVKGSLRVIRGGSWFDSPQLCRSAFRYGRLPGDRYDFQGFRLAFSLH